MIVIIVGGVLAVLLAFDVGLIVAGDAVDCEDACSGYQDALIVAFWVLAAAVVACLLWGLIRAGLFLRSRRAEGPGDRRGS